MFEELALHILDIAMNSLAANASRVEVAVVESLRHDFLIVRVRDNGRGMDAGMLAQVLDRGTTSKRSRKKNIGLGLAMLRQTSEMCEGRFHVRSAPGKGTSVTASMRLNHVDRPPLGDLQTTLLTLCAAAPAVDVRLKYITDTDSLTFSSQEGKTHEPRRTQETQGQGTAAGRVA
jgi:hypothetical protein